MNFALQINNTTVNHSNSKKWFFDIGTDINATNDIKNFVKGSVRLFKPREVAIRTDYGNIYPEKIGEVCLNVKGFEARARRLRFKNIFYVKNLPVNIISGELFYRNECSLQGEKFVDNTGNIMSLLNVSKRGFFLWFSREDEPIKHVNSGYPCQPNMNKTLKKLENLLDDTIRKLTL